MYEYEIKKEKNEYFFEIYSNKSKKIGTSKTYKTKEECKNKYKEFTEYIKTKKINYIKSEHILIENEKPKIIIEYIENQEVIFYKVMDKNELLQYKKIIKQLYEKIINNEIKRRQSDQI